MSPDVTKLIKKMAAIIIWDKVFKNRLNKFCGRQPLKNLKGYGLLKQTISLQIFLRLSSTNFTLSILEYFVPFSGSNLHLEFAELSSKLFPAFNII